MRVYVLTALVLVFASCETQELELVPSEVKADENGGDAGSGGRRGQDASPGERSGGNPGRGGDDTGGGQGAGGGPPSSGSGGERGEGGGKGNGARPSSGDGGTSGAGGGPAFSGGFPGLGGSPGVGGFSVPGKKCDQAPCPNGYCSPARTCVECLQQEHCRPGHTCDPVLFRCTPFCSSDAPCTGTTRSVCHFARHICVECIDNSECESKFRTRNICIPILGSCIQCGGDFECGPGGRCNPDTLRCVCADDTGCEENERCDDQHQCVLKPN